MDSKLLVVLAAGAAAFLYFNGSAKAEDPAQGGETTAGFGQDAGVATGTGAPQFAFNLPAPQAAPDLSGFFAPTVIGAQTKKEASTGASYGSSSFSLAPGSTPQNTSFDQYGQGSSTAYAGAPNFQPAQGGPGVYVAPPVSKKSAPATIGGVNNYLRDVPSSLGGALAAPRQSSPAPAQKKTNYLGFN